MRPQEGHVFLFGRHEMVASHSWSKQRACYKPAMKCFHSLVPQFKIHSNVVAMAMKCLALKYYKTRFMFVLCRLPYIYLIPRIIYSILFLNLDVEQQDMVPLACNVSNG